MIVETKKIKEMYQYLISDTTSIDNLTKSDGGFVFARFDPLVAKKAAELYHKQKANYLLVTGGVGKDSGILTEYGIPEASFQQSLLKYIHFVPENKIITEENAKNAGENSRFGIDLILEKNLPHKSLTLVLHPNSAKRVLAVYDLTAKNKNFQSTIQAVCTDYIFNPTHLQDQLEVANEFIKLAEWPGKEWCTAQHDLPQTLVDYAYALNSKFSTP